MVLYFNKKKVEFVLYQLIEIIKILIINFQGQGKELSAWNRTMIL